MSLRYATLVLAMAPIIAALLRVARTGYDLRYLYVALAGLLGAFAVLVLGGSSNQDKVVLVRLAVVTFLVSTLLGVLTARLLGARAVVGILLVAIVYALFFTSSSVLYSLSRSQRI